MKTIITLMVLLTRSLFAADTILIVRPDLPEFAKVADNTKSELGDQFSYKTLHISENSSYKVFAAEVRRIKPKLLLLLDNRAITFAKKFNQESDDYARNLKAVAAMALNMRKSLSGNKNICGVEYEVPAYSLLTQYRSLIKTRVKKALVFYRKSQHQAMIEGTKKQLKMEGIELVAVDVEKKTIKDTIDNFKDSFQQHIKRRDLDVVWVLPDNGLLNNLTLKTWLKGASHHKLPFVSTIDILVSKMDFCVYAAAPKLETLSLQLADLCLAILEDDEDPQELSIEYIRSVRRIASLKKMKKNHMKLDENQLKHCEQY